MIVSKLFAGVAATLVVGGGAFLWGDKPQAVPVKERVSEIMQESCIMHEVEDIVTCQDKAAAIVDAILDGSEGTDDEIKEKLCGEAAKHSTDPTDFVGKDQCTKVTLFVFAVNSQADPKRQGCAQAVDLGLARMRELAGRTHNTADLVRAEWAEINREVDHIAHDIKKTNLRAGRS